MEHSVARGRITSSAVTAGRACVWGRFGENASRLGEGDLRLPLVAAISGGGFVAVAVADNVNVNVNVVWGVAGL